jgi:hypothetical protein
MTLPLNKVTLLEDIVFVVVVMVDPLTSVLQDLTWINLCMLVEVHWGDVIIYA